MWRSRLPWWLKQDYTVIVKQARELVEKPEEFSIEFGVRLNSEAGVVIAKTAAEANLKISVKGSAHAGRLHVLSVILGVGRPRARPLHQCPAPGPEGRGGEGR